MSPSKTKQQYQTLRAHRLRRLRRHRRGGLLRRSRYPPRPPRRLRPCRHCGSSSARARRRLRWRRRSVRSRPRPRGRRLERVAHGRRGPLLARRPQRRVRRDRRFRGRAHVVAARRVVTSALGAGAGARQSHEAPRAAAVVAAAPAATIYDAAERAGEARRGHGFEMSADDGRAVKCVLAPRAVLRANSSRHARSCGCCE